MTTSLVRTIFTATLAPTRRRTVLRQLGNLVCAALFATMPWPNAALATPTGAIWVSGAEIQDYAYEASSQNHAGFNTTTKHSGNASFALHSGTISGVGLFQTPTWNSPVTNGTVYTSAWVYFGNNSCPLGCNGAFMIAAATVGPSNVAVLKFNAATSAVTLVRGTTPIGGAYTITTNAWHLFEMKIGIDADSNPDDVIEARIDGEVRSSQTTSSIDTGTSAVDALRFLSPNISTWVGTDVLVDDIIVTSDDYVGLDGHVIMRTADGPGFYGAGPSVVAFTGCSSYETCWSHVPPDDVTPTTYANDGTGSFAKFLATISDFSSGPEAITDVDSVFGCRGTWSIAKGPSGVNRNWQMLRRNDLTGAETSIPSSGALPLTTTFSRWDDLECTLTNCGPWGYCAFDCPTALDSVQIGGLRDNPSQAKVERIGDVYVSCAYRRNHGILIKTLAGTMDLGWKSGGQNQPIRARAMTADLSDCVGTSQTTCNISAARSGIVSSVTPSTNGGAPSCNVRTATGDLTGTITYSGTVSNVDFLEISLPEKLGVYGGISFATPCPTCSGAGVGDPGTCQGGPSNGQPCIVDEAYGAFGNTSANCLPVSASLFATLFPDVATKSTGSHSFAASHTCIGFGAVGLCHCSGQTYPNECSDLVCDPDETCAAGGGPYCLPDPIIRDGSTSPLRVRGIGCVPATGSSAVNTVVGLPGPIALSFDLRVSGSP